LNIQQNRNQRKYQLNRYIPAYYTPNFHPRKYSGKIVGLPIFSPTKSIQLIYSAVGKVGPVMTDFGREMVATMNRLGIIIDVAHMADESVKEVILASDRPIIDGHTCSKTFNAYSRGLQDWVLRLIAEGGGVVGIHFADHMFSRNVQGKQPAGTKH
jgi:hypothetical protein